MIEGVEIVGLIKSQTDAPSAVLVCPTSEEITAFLSSPSFISAHFILSTASPPSKINISNSAKSIHSAIEIIFPKEGISERVYLKKNKFIEYPEGKKLIKL
jgi:hypothetical protein